MSRIKIQQGDKSLPLIGQKEPNRITIEADKGVRACIASDLLLTKKFNELLSSLLIADNEVKERYSELEKDIEVPFKQYREILIKELTKEGYDYNDESSENEKKFSSISDRVQAPLKANKRKDLIQEIISKTRSMEDSIDGFEVTENIPKDKLDLLNNTRVYVCRECYQVISKKYFKHRTCNCGKNVVSHSDCEEVGFLLMSEEMVKFIKKNMWLEHGVEQMISKKGFSTECGVHLLGSSRALHEIDVIAEHNKERIIIECKTSELSVAHIFVLSGKMHDLGISRGYIFTVEGDIHPNVLKVARSRHIEIITNILVTDKSDVVEKMEMIQKNLFDQKRTAV